MKGFFSNVQSVFARFSDWKFALSAILLILVLTVTFSVMFDFFKNNNTEVITWFFVGYLLIMGIIFVINDNIKNSFFLLVPAVFVLAILFLYSIEIKRAIKHRKFQGEVKNVHKNYDESEVKNCISAIITALQNMSKKDIGAIIVLSNNNVPTQILDSGVMLNSDISSELIESVFFPKTPLHDGAMIINGTKIVASGCFLPLSQNENIPKDLGTRHRAGIGITETMDVTALIVSEETGIISIVKGGKITRYADTTMLKSALSKFYWQELTRTDR